MSQSPLANVDSSSAKTPPATKSSPESPSAPAKGTSPSTSGNNDPQLAGEGSLSESNSAHEAALRRLNGLDSIPKRDKKASDAGSTASTQPVLVRKYSHSSSSTGMKQPKMPQKRNSSRNRDSALPPLESFSFQDILASIDPEIQGSIDKIAEIYGRSRMSLADEYSSHLPPQGDFPMPRLQDHIDQAHVSRLEPVEEASSTHEDPTQGSRLARTRAARLSLIGNPASGPGDLSSNPVISTSTVAPSIQSTALQQGAGRSEIHPSYIPQLLAWLRGSQDDPNRLSHVSTRNSRAANALQRVLAGSVEPSPS
ncbi:MAG: hypothetical protein Q9211_006811 [Gyalolechia sp. 1 TL-2023]